MPTIARSMLENLDSLIEKDEREAAALELQKLTSDELAKVISLSRKKNDLLEILPPARQADVLSGLSGRIRKSLVKDLSYAAVLEICTHLDPTEMDILLALLPEDRAVAIRHSIDTKRSAVAEHVLPVEPETAETLMQSTFVLTHDQATVAEVSEKITAYLKNNETVPVVIVTDEMGELSGRVYLARLMNATRTTRITKIMEPIPRVSSRIDREEIVHILRKTTNDDTVVVVDEENRPVGVVHARDLLVVMEDEVTEDLYNFAGVYGQERPIEPIQRTVKMRYRWLLLNLATALLAASVVQLFEGTLSEMVILAAYMPVVAGMGGNAGTQTLAVVVRGLSLNQIPKGSGRKVLLKETSAAVINGLITGFVVAILAALWHQNIMLGVVLWISMVISLLTAGLFGTIIPIGLKKLGYDPAISSSIFLTTFTDIIGFLTFLGLATWLLI